MNRRKEAINSECGEGAAMRWRHILKSRAGIGAIRNGSIMVAAENVHMREWHQLMILNGHQTIIISASINSVSSGDLRG